MKYLNYLIITVISLLYSNTINANSITFSPTTQSVSVNSGEEIEVTIQLNCYGSNSGASSWFINPHQIPDNGYLNHSPGTGAMYVGDVTTVTFRFKSTVSNTTTTSYVFRYDWTDEVQNSHNGLLYINVTYTNDNTNPDSDGDGVIDSQDNCPNDVGPASNDGCPITTCTSSAPSNLTTTFISSNSATISWDAIPNQNGYEGLYNENRNQHPSGLIPFSTNNTKFLFSGLKPDIEYRFIVWAICNSGNSERTTLRLTTLKECEENLTLNNSVYSINSIKASNNITSHSKIENGAEMLYSAGKDIILSYNFHAKPGSLFRAYIEDCSSTSAKNDNSKTIEESSIKLYPNPTSSIINISSTENIASWKLYNNLGAVYISGNAKSQDLKALDLNLSDYPTGMYMLRIHLNTGQHVIKKIVKN